MVKRSTDSPILKLSSLKRVYVLPDPVQQQQCGTTWTIIGITDHDDRLAGLMKPIYISRYIALQELMTMVTVKLEGAISICDQRANEMPGMRHALANDDQ